MESIQFLGKLNKEVKLLQLFNKMEVIQENPNALLQLLIVEFVEIYDLFKYWIFYYDFFLTNKY